MSQSAVSTAAIALIVTGPGRPFAARVRPSGPGHPTVGRRGAASMNFALGIAEMARAIADDRAPRLAGDFALHLTELSLAMQAGGDHYLRTSFAPIAPMDWGR